MCLVRERVTNRVEDADIGLHPWGEDHQRIVNDRCTHKPGCPAVANRNELKRARRNVEDANRRRVVRCEDDKVVLGKSHYTGEFTIPERMRADIDIREVVSRCIEDPDPIRIMRCEDDKIIHRQRRANILAVDVVNGVLGDRNGTKSVVPDVEDAYGVGVVRSKDADASDRAHSARELAQALSNPVPGPGGGYKFEAWVPRVWRRWRRYWWRGRCGRGRWRWGQWRR
jgi:hypothetical protein